MVPFGVQVFVAKRRARRAAGRSLQLVGGKAEKRNRRESSLSAVLVNWFGALIPLPYRKLPERNPLRNKILYIIAT